MEEKKKIKVSLSTVLLILSLIVIIAMAYYIYIEKTNADKESNTTSSENVVTELSLGSYQVTQHIVEDEGVSYDDVGVTLASNNICSVYEGFGISFIGTYSIENNKMICNTIICRGESGGIAYSEGNIIFEFEIIGKDEIKLVNVINKSNNTYNDIALKSGMTYKLSDANIKVLIDND